MQVLMEHAVPQGASRTLPADWCRRNRLASRLMWEGSIPGGALQRRAPQHLHPGAQISTGIHQIRPRGAAAAAAHAFSSWARLYTVGHGQDAASLDEGAINLQVCDCLPARSEPGAPVPRAVPDTDAAAHGAAVCAWAWAIQVRSTAALTRADRHGRRAHAPEARPQGASADPAGGPCSHGGTPGGSLEGDGTQGPSAAAPRA